MRFAASIWLFGTLLAALVAALFVVGSVLRSRNLRNFADEQLMGGLLTAQAGGRRALKGVLCVLAVALAFVAAAQPQYGKGTRLIPATNLDLVIVLDYSKSMYARDIAPSRTVRAKSEVARLISSLPGARFGAVGFAGDTISFPLTSDGPAISQFFQQMTPNDMPVGGTAIARALEAGRDLLKRDPLSKTHKQVMLLVTDGEDLEGDPVSVAKAAADDQTTIFVVQIGGRTPEPIPLVDENGEVKGIRTDDDGKPLTTSLSAEGEAQLGTIASSTGGAVVRSEAGQTGLSEIERRLKQLMTEELSERVETIYADVYFYPLGLALLLVLVEAFVPEARARKPSVIPPPRKRKTKRRTSRVVAGTLLLAFGYALLAVGCTRQKNQLWMRNAPAVDEAIAAYDAGDAGAAVSLLEGYLATGKCEQSNIGAPETVRSKPNATFDLGLGLFKLGEQYGLRFGEEEPPAGKDGKSPEAEAAKEKRSSEVECALRVVRIIAADGAVPIDLRARAFYLAGNLEFLRGDYESAVKSYDASLELIPGLPEDGGDGIGRDSAFNRSIALGRIEKQKKDDEDKKKDAGADASPDSGEPDGGQKPDGGEKPDGGQKEPENKQEPDGGQPDAGQKREPSQPDGGQPDAGQKPEAQPPAQKPEQPKNQDDRLLDMLERAPSVQHQDAKNRGLSGRARTEDK